MGRTATAIKQPAEAPEILPAVAARIEAAQDLAAHAKQDAAELAEQIGYLLPGGSADPDLIQRDIAANMQRSVQSVLEVGRGLLVLKAACGHGNFGDRLKVLGLEARLSRRFMQAAVKFSKRASTPVLEAAGSQTKLFELLVLDDESIQALEEDGVAPGGLTLDDVARMSTSELRAALREARAEREADRELLARKNEAIDNLKRQSAGAKTAAWTDWEERVEPMVSQADYASKEVMKRLGDLCAITQAAIQINLPEEAPDGQKNSLERARATLAARMDNAYREIAHYFERTRLLFDQTLAPASDDLNV